MQTLKVLFLKACSSYVCIAPRKCHLTSMSDLCWPLSFKKHPICVQSHQRPRAGRLSSELHQPLGNEPSFCFASFYVRCWLWVTFLYLWTVGWENCAFKWWNSTDLLWSSLDLGQNVKNPVRCDKFVRVTCNLENKTFHQRAKQIGLTQEKSAEKLNCLVVPEKRS